MVRVMSFNLRCSNVGEREQWDRVDDCIKTILDSGCELLGVQEATPEWMADLTKNLDGWDYIGIGRGDRKGGDSEYSAIFYKKDRFEAVESGNFWYSDTPDVMSPCWTSYHHRICTWGIFYDKKEDKKFVHVNTHMDCDFDLIYKSIPILRERIEPLSEKYPLSCSGDFNSFQNGREYNEVIKFLRDSKFVAPDSMESQTFHGDEPTKHGTEIIDYIFINDKVNAYKYRVLNEKINGNYASDHFAIYADLDYLN